MAGGAFQDGDLGAAAGQIGRRRQPANASADNQNLQDGTATRWRISSIWRQW